MEAVVALISALLLGASALVLIPVVVFFLQCLAFVLGRGHEPAIHPRQQHAHSSAPPRFAVLIPAHDEALIIADTVRHVLLQLGPTGSLLVVADNCSDQTASLAREAGATVTERFDLTRRGKGFALDWGVRQLAAEALDVVVVFDADCRVTQGSLNDLAAAALQRQRPVQGVYRMDLPASPSLAQRVGAFAWEVKNRVRPGGGRHWGTPCPLMGTGMAFPWALIASSPLASSNLVEDLQLGIDLAIKGQPAWFFTGLEVSSQFPASADAARTQRTRWEQGTLSTMRTQVPRLIHASAVQRRGALLSMALDLSVPPLALLASMVFGLLAANLAWWAVTASASGLPWSLGALVLLSSAVLLAWASVGRSLLSGRQLLGIPLYMAAKLPLYGRWLLGRRQTDWVRTERDRKP